MNSFGSWLLDYFANSFWQAPVIFLAALIITHLARRTTPEAQHRIWVGALVAEVILPGVSVKLLWFLSMWRLLITTLFRGDQAPATGITVSTSESTVRGVFAMPALLSSAITWLYIGVNLYFIGRLIYGVWTACSLARNARPVTLSAADQERYFRLQARFGLTHTKLAESNRVSGPSTVGTSYPVLIVPPGFTTESRMEDLDAAFAHEFAHVARHDFAKNLLYELISIPLSHHPVRWLTRARVLTSREVVCDARAAAAAHGNERYARSLLRLAAACITPPTTTPHAIGIFDAYSLERRIMMLSTRPTYLKAPQRIAIVIAGFLVAILAGGSALAMHVSLTGKSGSGVPQSSPEGHAARISGGVMAGNILSRVNPTYPKEARAAGVSGSVVLHAIIGKDGSIENLSVISGPDELRASAIDAVRQWTYRPYILNGEPVDVDTTITVNYQIAR